MRCEYLRSVLTIRGLLVAGAALFLSSSTDAISSSQVWRDAASDFTRLIEQRRLEQLRELQSWRTAVVETDGGACIDDQRSAALPPKCERYLRARYAYSFHMLRWIFGDAKFFHCWQKFEPWLATKGELTDRDIQLFLEDGLGGIDENGNHYNVDLGWFFDQWTRSAGIPLFRTEYDVRQSRDGSWIVQGFVQQRVVVGTSRNYEPFKGASFRGLLNLTIETKKGKYDKRLVINGPTTQFMVKVPKPPIEVAVNKNGEVLSFDAPTSFADLDEVAGVAMQEAGAGSDESTNLETQRPEKFRLPARLVTTVRWVGLKPFIDGALDAEESGELHVQVANEGEGLAMGIDIKLSPTAISGVEFANELHIKELKPHSSETIRIPFHASINLPEAITMLRFDTVDSLGHAADPVEFPLVTRAVVPPNLEVYDYAFSGDFEGSVVPRDRLVTVRIRVRNSGQGRARGVVAHVSTGRGVFRAAESMDRFSLGDLEAGEIREFDFTCYATDAADEMALRIDFEEDRPRFSVDGVSVLVPLAELERPIRVVRVEVDERTPVDLTPPPSLLMSDVDREIPRSSVERGSGLAVIFGVEEYATGPPAVYAANDGTTARDYFERVLGIPADRIQVLKNGEVTLTQFRRIFGEGGWLDRRVEEGTEVFVYFSGHGMPDFEEKTAYLMPSDGDVNYVRLTGYRLDEMLTQLDALGARQATVFLDSCFSGLDREGQTLQVGARPFAVAVNPVRATRVSVFAAARGTQIASSLEAEGHGLFSYFLFKGLAGAADTDSDGRVTTGELKVYLEEEIPRAASKIDREQTPNIRLSSHDLETVLSAPIKAAK